MLIWIDSSVLNADLAADHDCCHGISAIFDAVYRGEHYAIGARDTLAALAHNENLSSLTRTTIATVRANLPTLGAIDTEIFTRLQVTHGKAAASTRAAETQWEVPLKEIGIHGVMKAVLLTENLDDAKAYEHAARQYQVAIGMSGQVTLEKAGGGGSTTPESFENHAHVERRWCLCITDSDRLCPSANMSATGRKCSDIAESDSVVASHIDLTAREIENILPIAFLAEAIPSSHQALWDWHIERLHGVRSDAHHYCDIKNGITFRKVLSYPENTPARIFWDSVTTDLKRAAALTSDCFAVEDCARDATAPCECYVAPGFGEKVLESVIKKLESRSVHLSEKLTRRDANRQPWMDIGRFVFEWGCAPARTRL